MPRAAICFVQLWHAGRTTHVYGNRRAAGPRPLSDPAYWADPNIFRRGPRTVFFRDRRAASSVGERRRFAVIIKQYRTAAVNAKACRVRRASKVMAANGHLIDQFSPGQQQQAHRPLRRLGRKTERDFWSMWSRRWSRSGMQTVSGVRIAPSGTYNGMGGQ